MAYSKCPVKGDYYHYSFGKQMRDCTCQQPTWEQVIRFPGDRLELFIGFYLANI